MGRIIKAPISLFVFISSLVVEEKFNITAQVRDFEKGAKKVLFLSDSLINVFVFLSSFHQMMDPIKNSMRIQTYKIMPVIREPGYQRKGGQKLKVTLEYTRAS